MSRGLFWFRDDLRLQANELLARALGENDELLCVYIHDPRLFQKTCIGLPRLGWHRRRFLKETLADLNNNLRSIQLELVELWGEPEDVIPRLAEECSIDTVYFSRECGLEEQTIENMLRAKLDSGVRCISQWSCFLVRPENLPLQISEIPDVYSDFRRHVERSGIQSLVDRLTSDVSQSGARPRTPRVALRAEYKIASGISTQFSGPEWWKPLPEEMVILDRVAEPKGPVAKMELMRGGEKIGRGRVEDYIFKTRSIGTYYQTRNGLLSVSDSTLFSPWLANGSLAAQWIYSQVTEYERQNGASKDSYWVVVELLWRDFFKFMLLKHKAHFFHPAGLQKKVVHTGVRRNEEEGLAKLLAAETDEPFVNANMRELIQTGFMSNRGRQNVASYAIHHLNIPWIKGAWMFESLLVDYDVASNWGNWAYLAGVGNDPRGVRIFDVRKQQEMYDPQGEYTAAWTKS